MQLRWKHVLLTLVGCLALCGELAAAPLAHDSRVQQAGQPAKPADDSDRKPSTETAPAIVPDSTKLEPIKIQKADYPVEAAEKKLQGQVWIKILISETGDVESAEVISGDPILADSALRAAKKWKFKPFIKNGKPIKVSTKVPFDFAFSDKIMEKGVSADQSTTTDFPKQPSQTPPASDPTAPPPKRVRVGAGVSTGFLVHQVAPVYPSEARRDRIQGVVVLQAVINKEGRIADLKLVSGPKELVQAAIGAVQQWRYRPYLFNGEPVEVETQVQVNFRLR